MTRLLLLALALVAAPAGAQQAPAQTPSPKPQAEPAKERRPLNLQLDNPSSFATIAPAEKPPEKGLPTLGGDARPANPGGVYAPSRDPIPKDTNPIR